jgi:hypothetical protein
VIISPSIQRPPAQFRAVINDQDIGVSPFTGHAFQHLDHPLARQREVHLDGRTFARAVVQEGTSTFVSGHYGGVFLFPRPTVPANRDDRCGLTLEDGAVADDAPHSLQSLIREPVTTDLAGSVSNSRAITSFHKQKKRAQWLQKLNYFL